MAIWFVPSGSARVNSCFDPAGGQCGCAGPALQVPLTLVDERTHRFVGGRLRLCSATPQDISYYSTDRGDFEDALYNQRGRSAPTVSDEQRRTRIVRVAMIGFGGLWALGALVGVAWAIAQHNRRMQRYRLSPSVVQEMGTLEVTPRAPFPEDETRHAPAQINPVAQPPALLADASDEDAPPNTADNLEESIQLDTAPLPHQVPAEAAAFEAAAFEVAA